MTISVGFISRTATIAGVALNGTTTFGISEGGIPIDVRSDGELFPRVTPIIPTPVEIDFETRDIAAAITPGTTGTFSMVADKMTGGKTLSGTVTISNVTSATCTVLNVSRGTDISGAAVLRGTARVNSADGSASGVQVVSA